MLTLSSLFALLLRVSLLCQGQVEGITDSVQLDFFENTAIQTEEGHIQQPILTFEGLGSLVPSIEIEERTEVESEKTSSDFILGTSPSFRQFTFLKVCNYLVTRPYEAVYCPCMIFFIPGKFI